MMSDSNNSKVEGVVEAARTSIFKRLLFKIKSWRYRFVAGFKTWVFKSLFKQKNSNLVKHAIREMKIVGLDQADSDYSGMLYDAVLDLMRLFSFQGHSGFSAARTTQLFHQLSQYKNLAPLTTDPKEWTAVYKNKKGKQVYQNKRCSACFTESFKTYYSVNDVPRKNLKLKNHKAGAKK